MDNSQIPSLNGRVYTSVLNPDDRSKREIEVCGLHVGRVIRGTVEIMGLKFRELDVRNNMFWLSS